MTVLVTGGTGLVGSRLLKRIVEDGIETRGLVRAGKELPSGVAAVEGDILDPETLPTALDGVSDVIHLAALFRTADDDAVWRVNRDGTRNVVAAIQQHAPDARLIMASTSNVYVADLTHPATAQPARLPRRPPHGPHAGRTSSLPASDAPSTPSAGSLRPQQPHGRGHHRRRVAPAAGGRHPLGCTCPANTAAEAT